MDQPRSKPNDNTAKGSGWGASPPKPTSDGWGSSGGWGNNEPTNGGGWGESVSWNGENRESKSPKSWGDTTSNDRNVTYTNDRTMIVSKPVENSSWGMRHDTGRKG